jgi:hypothetical protein
MKNRNCWIIGTPDETTETPTIPEKEPEVEVPTLPEEPEIYSCKDDSAKST